MQPARPLAVQAARHRQRLPALEHDQHNDNDALMSYLEAMTNAAACASCAFYDAGLCKALPPRVTGTAAHPVAAWPPVQPDDWCGSWASA